jgi:two-component system KDP operon response regulator KdpE
VPDVALQSDIRVIGLSVMDLEMVAAMDAADDDYITKPFSMEELLARIRAVLRRYPFSPVGGQRSFIGRDLEIDFATRRVRVHGVDVLLTPTECKLLR